MKIEQYFNWLSFDVYYSSQLVAFIPCEMNIQKSFLKQPFLFLTLFIKISQVHSRNGIKSANKITVAASVYEPFVGYDSHNRDFKGLDVTILKNFGKKLNVPIEFVNVDFIRRFNVSWVFDSSCLCQTIWKTENTFSAIDILIGYGASSRKNSIEKYFVASRPYYQDTLTWCVKKNQLAPLWKQLYLIMKQPWIMAIWIFTGAILICLAYYLQQFETFKWNINEILIFGSSITFGYGYSYQPRCTIHRILFLTFAFGSLINYTVFFSFWLKTITEPYLDREIRTVDEILSYDLNLAGEYFAFQQLNKQNAVSWHFLLYLDDSRQNTKSKNFQRYPISVLNKFKICDNISVHLNQLENEANLAVATSLAYIQSTGFIEKKNIYCFKNSEVIYNYGLKVLMNKNFRFAHDLNKFIKYAAEGGLTKKWLAIRDAPFKPVTKEIAPLNLQFCEGFSYILGVCIVLAIFVFIAELIIHQKVRQKNAAMYWRLAEKAIDPNRYYLLWASKLGLLLHLKGT